MEKRGFLVYCTLINPFVTDYTKVIHISVEAYCPNKDSEGWERKLIQQEPNPINIFVYEEKSVEFFGQETNPAAPAEVTFVPQVEKCFQAMQRLKNFI